MDEGEFAGDKNAMIMNDKIVRTSADPLHPLWLLLCAWNFTLCQADSMSNCVPIVIHLVPYFHCCCCYCSHCLAWYIQLRAQWKLNNKHSCVHFAKKKTCQLLAAQFPLRYDILCYFDRITLQ